MDALQHRIQALQPRAEALCAALRGEAERVFGAEAAADCTPGTAVFRLERDPASGADSLVGEWQDEQGYRIGMLVFHLDGSCFGERDLVRMHPHKQGWFVEAVEAWAGPANGTDAGVVHAELRLLAAP
jgi:hypothetical protein